MNRSFAQWYGKFADIPTRFSIKRFLHGLLMKMHTARLRAMPRPMNVKKQKSLQFSNGLSSQPLSNRRS